MRILSTVSAAAIALALATAGSSSVGDSGRTYTFAWDNVLGTSLDLKVVAPSMSQARKAESVVLAEIDRESKILSSWDQSSEFSRWFRTQGQAVPVSPELYQVLGMYDQWRARTNGALDPSAESVIQVWKAAAKANRLPTSEELAGAVAKTGERQWTLDAVHHTATHTGNTPLVLASFTKSYIIDRAADAAMRTGVRAVVVNIGGDLAVRGAV